MALTAARRAPALAGRADKADKREAIQDLRDVDAIVRARVCWPRRRAARVGRAATGEKRSAATKHLPARARAGRESPNRPASRSSEHLHLDLANEASVASR